MEFLSFPIYVDSTTGILEVFPELECLGCVMAVYRKLRENYEYRLRYDEANKFFIKEMELKRNYRTVRLRDNNGSEKLIKNNPLRKHFSLTGLYYHFSAYGESIARPTIIGAITSCYFHRILGRRYDTQLDKRNFYRFVPIVYGYKRYT